MEPSSTTNQVRVAEGYQTHRKLAIGVFIIGGLLPPEVPEFRGGHEPC